MSKLIGLAALTLILVSGCANYGKARFIAREARDKQRSAIVWGRYLPPLMSAMSNSPTAPFDVCFDLERPFAVLSNQLHARGKLVMGSQLVGDYHVEFGYDQNSLEPFGFREAIRLNFNAITAKKKEDIRQWLERRYQKDVNFEIDGKPNRLWEYEVTMAQDRYPSLHAGVLDPFRTTYYSTYRQTGEEFERVMRSKILMGDAQFLWKAYGYNSSYERPERGIDRGHGVVLFKGEIIAVVKNDSSSMDGAELSGTIDPILDEAEDFQWPKAWIGLKRERLQDQREKKIQKHYFEMSTGLLPNSVSFKYRVSAFSDSE